MAHLGYFREQLVERRRWVGEATYAELIAIAQLLPGPASSQVGFAIGLLAGGWRGGLAAWTAFTLPSACLLVAFGYFRERWNFRWMDSVTHGFEVAALAIVAQAIVALGKRLTPDRRRLLIALASAVLVLFRSSFHGSVIAIALGAVAGLLFCRYQGAADAYEHGSGTGTSRRAGFIALALFFVLLVVSGLAGRQANPSTPAVFAAFYRAGALVFGGGHVVLPLLASETVTRGWVEQSTFLAGYGAAQAIPGPLFTFAAYLGFVLKAPLHGLPGAALALVAIFLPGLLLMSGALPWWSVLKRNQAIRAALAGVNASVVGLLGAALYNPLWKGAVKQPADIVIAAVAALLLLAAKAPSWSVVAGSAVAAVILRQFGGD